MKVAKMDAQDLAFIRKSHRTHAVQHLLTCYEVLFEHCCDPNAKTLEWSPELVAQKAELEQLRDRVNRTREALKESLEHHEKLDSVEGLAVTQQLEWVLDMLEDKKND